MKNQKSGKLKTSKMCQGIHAKYFLSGSKDLLKVGLRISVSLFTSNWDFIRKYGPALIWKTMKHQGQFTFNAREVKRVSLEKIQSLLEIDL